MRTALLTAVLVAGAGLAGGADPEPDALRTWLLVTKGTEYDLAPAAAAGKVPLVPTIYAEADGKPLPSPDPADPTKCEFAWMTAHKYTADRAVPYPFRDWNTLKTK